MTELSIPVDHHSHLIAPRNQQTSGITNPEQWLIDTLGGSRSASGQRVNTGSVLGLPAAWRSVDLVSSILAKMPVQVQRRANESWIEIPNHPVDRLMNRLVSGLYTPFTFRQTMTLHSLLIGNGRALIQKDGNDNPVSLTLMQPEQTYTVVLNGDKFHVVYFRKDQYGDVLTPELEEQLSQYSRSNSPGGQYWVPDMDVLHIPGMSYNGLWGMSLVDVARDAFGVSQSGLDAVSYQFRNGGRPGLLLTAPKGLLRTAKEADEFMAHFRKEHDGVANQGRTGLLREGMTAAALASSEAFKGVSDLKDSTKSDIALFFGTEYMLGEAAAVYKDLQSRVTAFHQFTLDNWVERWEQECGRKLLNRQRFANGTMRVHYDPTSVLRGTPNELATYTGQLRTQGLVNGNEARKYHNLPPVPELEDDYGNPATSSPNQTEEEPTEQPPPEETEENGQDQELNRGRRAVQRHFNRMRQFEARRVAECAKSASGFTTRIDEFYTLFAEQLTELCDDLLIDRSLAVKHCTESKSIILEIAGVVFGDEQLQSEIKTATDTLEERYAQFSKV